MDRIGQIICARFLILSKLTFNVPSTFEAKILMRLRKQNAVSCIGSIKTGRKTFQPAFTYPPPRGPKGKAVVLAFGEPAPTKPWKKLKIPNFI
jgi:hypothetical protein